MDDSGRQLGILLLVPLLVVGAIAGTQFLSPKKPAPVAADPAPAEIPIEETESITLSKIEQQNRVRTQSLATLETSGFVAKFTNLNTAMTSLRVKGKRFKEEDGPHELVTTDKEQYLPLAIQLAGVDIPPDAVWSLESSNERSLRYSWSDNDTRITRSWDVTDKAYDLKSTVTVENTAAKTRAIQLSLTSAHYVKRANEKGGFLFFTRPSPKVTSALCRVGDETIREDREELLTPQQHGPDVQFVSLSSIYFSVIMAPENATAEQCLLKTTNRGGTFKDPEGSLFEAEMVYPKAELPSGETISFVTEVYAGPKDVDALAEFGRGAEDVIDLGWFGFIAGGMNWSLRKIYDLVGNWGLAIILLTLIVRLAILPLVTTQYRNMAKQRALKPEVDRINELYKDDREAKGREMMELWRKHKVNPLGGCLPVLLQMPIFFALYQSLLTNIELYHAPFIWWWTDLSAPDPYYVLPALLGLLMFLQQKLTPISVGDPMQQKIIMYVMPIGISLFMLVLPSGLGLYMMTSYTLGIAQQRYMYWKMDQQTPSTNTDEETESEDDSASADVASSPTRAKAQRKKRPRRGRA